MRRRTILLALVVTSSAIGLAAAVAFAARGPGPVTEVEIAVRYSRFAPAEVVVPLGVPVTFRLVNADPIDHEWIVGDDAVHAVHRVDTEPLHPSRPEEVVLPALATRITTITFDRPGRLAFICHLPGHEAYGMVGAVIIRG